MFGSSTIFIFPANAGVTRDGEEEVRDGEEEVRSYLRRRWRLETERRSYLRRRWRSSHGHIASVIAAVHRNTRTETTRL